jgi:DNA adenine methylase
MKTPIRYWGGKQQLSAQIIAIIPPHECYTEAFFGGGAVFFSKPSSKVEMINDINDNMVNFYRMMKKQFNELAEEIDLTLFSEFQYNHAKKLWSIGFTEDADKVKRAWSVFVLSQQGFNGIMGSTWTYTNEKNVASRFDKLKKEFAFRYINRLENTQIFCRDAVQVIEDTDGKQVFHFVDPPYFNSDMAHYGGYTEDDFKRLLKVLENIEGKFLLTSYPSDILKEYSERNGWITINNEMHLSASLKAGKKKTEVFTLNYKPVIQSSLF